MVSRPGMAGSSPGREGVFHDSRRVNDGVSGSFQAYFDPLKREYVDLRYSGRA